MASPFPYQEKLDELQRTVNTFPVNDEDARRIAVEQLPHYERLKALWPPLTSDGHHFQWGMALWKRHYDADGDEIEPQAFVADPARHHVWHGADCWFIGGKDSSFSPVGYGCIEHLFSSREQITREQIADLTVLRNSIERRILALEASLPAPQPYKIAA